jgi:hypothetical protein
MGMLNLDPSIRIDTIAGLEHEALSELHNPAKEVIKILLILVQI